MAEELSKIEKPEASQFREKKKLFLVPLLFSWESAPPEFIEKFNLYWQQVAEYIVNLESKLGSISRVYHESVTADGEDGLKLLEKLNPHSYKISEYKCQSGASLEATEDKDLADECVDWERHLLIGFVSPKVAKIISDSFIEATKKRYEHIANRIKETLKENEVAILFIRESHMVQFPPDVEVFSVLPPVLDEIHRWLREYQSAGKGEKTE